MNLHEAITQNPLSTDTVMRVFSQLTHMGTLKPKADRQFRPEWMAETVDTVAVAGMQPTKILEN